MQIVSLFSGAGGFDLGFIQAGHEVVWANDIDHDCCETYRRNIGDHVVEGDISKIDADAIPDCDVVIGGFPCQGFSLANIKRHAKDARNKLYVELLRVIEAKQPKYFVAENVKGLLYMEGGMVLGMIMEDFAKAGYQVRYRVLNAADYGVPQKRERVIIIGVRTDMKDKIKFPEPTHFDPTVIKNSYSLKKFYLQHWVPIGKALDGIPEPEDAPSLPNHSYSRFKLKFNGYLGNRAIDPEKPAPTVTARGDNRGGVVVLHHPKNHRRMSARELAIAQSFPLSFEFVGCRSSVYRQIGNAVPPMLAKSIGLCFTVNV